MEVKFSKEGKLTAGRKADETEGKEEDRAEGGGAVNKGQMRGNE